MQAVFPPEQGPAHAGLSTLAALRRGALAGARRVDLAGLGTGLKALPRELFDLADTLEVLDLSGNALDHLPDDLGRLHRLRAIFCSGNPFSRLPAALGGCAALTQIGFRGCGLREVPAEALPAGLRWLTLTDNRLETLPSELGRRPALEKLMLAGNRLRRLPGSLAQAENLALLRLSANALEAWPAGLSELPRLAWLAWAGNPFEPARGQGAAVPDIAWQQLRLGGLLGEGASGHIRQAQWRAAAGGADRPVAVKLFKGRMTSDGLPDAEMAACLAAGDHPHLIGALGRVSGHPAQAAGLVMPLLPPGWRALAGPPSLASCSRDVYDPALRLGLPVALRIAAGVGAALAHLQAQGLQHGDVYAHNTVWDGGSGRAMLGDFGAASFVPAGVAAAPLQRLEVRAWGLLLAELLACCEAVPAPLTALAAQCTQTEPARRPALTDALHALHSLAPSVAPDEALPKMAPAPHRPV